jgi:hypothetical protein
MEQILELVANGVPNARVADLIKMRRVNHKPSSEDLDNLRIAGADDEVVQALRDLKFTRGTIHVYTVLGAAVYLDNAAKGITGSNGQLVIESVNPGTHIVGVDFEGRSKTRTVSVSAGDVVDVKIPM